MRSMLEAVRRGKGLAPLQTERLTRDGETVTIWLTATALVDESGRPYGISTTERPLEPGAPEGG
jgi:two-component system CheB/CheR fusion protein